MNPLPLPMHPAPDESATGTVRPPEHDILFQELQIGTLTLKNRLLRSSISGRIDNYDGSGTRARINFENRFASGGVGAIISSHVPVHVKGRILPNYATIDRDERIKFWKCVAQEVRARDSRFILQLSHGGRQQDIGGVENWLDDFHNAAPLSSTNEPDFFNGLPGRAMSPTDIREVVGWFVDGARRACEAGVDGLELHSSNGYLFTQFLSAAINDRATRDPEDPYGGCLENRYRFLHEVITAIRSEVGRSVPLIVKLSAVEHDNWLFPFRHPGNNLEDSVRVARWAAADGADAIHVSVGSTFPHPRNPAGPFPFELAARTYTSMIDSGKSTWRNYLLFRYLPWLARYAWQRNQRDFRAGKRYDGDLLPDKLEGLSAEAAGRIRRGLRDSGYKIPVICTGGFQTGDGISRVLHSELCDAVAIARPLLANPNLPNLLKQGRAPEFPCTYCNKCLVQVLENPLGCYDETRFRTLGGREEMIKKIMAIFTDEACCATEDKQEQNTPEEGK